MFLLMPSYSHGAGGIGFDVAEMLVEHNEGDDSWYQKWNIDKTYQQRGGVLDDATVSEDTFKSSCEIYLLQRKDEKLGKNLARTTGWIRRLSLRRAGVRMMPNITYKKIDDQGLHIISDGKEMLLAVDHIVVCAGQESEDSLYQQLSALGKNTYVIGGAKKAAELDAETAIREGMQLAYDF
jgi:2,4-dienoyl-CoA reductase (NADPH2)